MNSLKEMQELQAFSSSRNSKGQLLTSLRLKGTEQMAIDLMLLDRSITKSEFEITMRFYSWVGNWLSIGKNQNHIPKKWLELNRLKKLNIVRRPSGGKAVLHSGGITYCLIWKSPPKRKKEAYLEASKWLIKGFSKLGIALHFGNQKINALSEDCFATSTAADLVDDQGQKRVGSAQFWKRGHLLQHGEILRDPPKELWLDLFNTPRPKPLGISVDNNEIETILKNSLIENWPEIKWQENSLKKKDLEEIKRKKNYFLSEKQLF